ncbi:MAG: flagellar biosynthetic protein FliR [Candidatus Melainabacteria bacterium]
MDLSLLTTQTVLAFLLIVFRVSGMILSAPLMNGHSIPVLTKIGITLTIAFLFFPIVAMQLVVPRNLFTFCIVGAQELAIGLMIGFAANMVFVALQMAGEYISYQMGLSVSNMVDPLSGVSVPTLGMLYYYFALLLFLSLNAHHILILAVQNSFDVLPLGHWVTHGGQLAERFITLSGEMFATALVIVAPVMGLLLATEISLGYMAKVMPQMNIFMLGLPVKVGMGLIGLAVTIPYASDMLTHKYDTLYQHLLMLFGR